MAYSLELTRSLLHGYTHDMVNFHPSQPLMMQETLLTNLGKPTHFAPCNRSHLQCEVLETPNFEACPLQYLKVWSKIGDDGGSDAGPTLRQLWTSE